MTLCSFFFNDPAPTDIYTLSLHDALPISIAAAGSAPASSAGRSTRSPRAMRRSRSSRTPPSGAAPSAPTRSEEHTSELQSLRHLVCRLLLEKKKKKKNTTKTINKAKQINK